MRDPSFPSGDSAWWPADWQGGQSLNTDKVDDWQITPRELQRRLDLGEPIVLVDVRERWEADIVSLPEARLIPLNELNYRAEEEIEPDDEVVLFCHHGLRSMEAAMMLWDMGYERVRSLAGGLERWAAEVDPDLPRY